MIGTFVLSVSSRPTFANIGKFILKLSKSISKVSTFTCSITLEEISSLENTKTERNLFLIFEQ